MNKNANELDCQAAYVVISLNSPEDFMDWDNNLHTDAESEGVIQ